MILDYFANSNKNTVASRYKIGGDLARPSLFLKFTLFDDLETHVISETILWSAILKARNHCILRIYAVQSPILAWARYPRDTQLTQTVRPRPRCSASRPRVGAKHPRTIWPVVLCATPPCAPFVCHLVPVARGSPRPPPTSGVAAPPPRSSLRGGMAYLPAPMVGNPVPPPPRTAPARDPRPPPRLPVKPRLRHRRGGHVSLDGRAPGDRPRH